MSTDFNIPILGRIATAIHPDKENYVNGRDYYGSPVHTALGRDLNDDSWPKIRKEYLLDAKGRLTKFPHNEGLSGAEERDLPATFFYEVIQRVKVKETDNSRNFPTECASYYDSQGKESWSEKTRRNYARRMFFSCYAFILGQEIVKYKITVDQLKSVFNDPPLDNGIGEAQHDSYIDKIYKIYCGKPGKFLFKNKAPRPHDYLCHEFNKNPILSGPIFMTKIFELNFESYSKDEKSGKSGTYVDFSNAGFLESGNTKELDFEKGGCKHAAILFVFCAAAERVLLGKSCCHLLRKKSGGNCSESSIRCFFKRRPHEPPASP